MKQRNLFFMIFILAFSFFYSGKAQWISRNIDTKENLTDVIMLDSTKAIVIGNRNGIFRTTDSGLTWINETIMLSAVYHWNAISFSDSLNGTIAGDNAIWKTADGGIKWNYCIVPSSNKNISILQINPGNIYVGDDSGFVYHSIDSGKTWSSEKITELPVRSIYPFKANPEIFGQFENLIFALTPNSLFVKELNDTSSWKDWGNLGYFSGLGSGAFKGAFSEDGTEFIVGVEGDLFSQSAIIRLRPPDSHWYFVGPSHEIGELRGLSIPSSNIIYTCGYNGKILKSANEGNDWFTQKTSVSRSLNSIYFFDDKRGFAVGDSGTILYTQNGGGGSNEEYGQLIPYGLQDKIITSLSGEEPDYNNSYYLNFNYIFAGTEGNGIFKKSIAAGSDGSSDWTPLGFNGKSISALTLQHWGVGPIDGFRLFAAVTQDSSQNDSALIFSREVNLTTDTNWIRSDNGISDSVKRINSLDSYYYTGHTPPQPVIAGTNSGIYVRRLSLWSQSEIEDEKSQPVIASIDVAPHWLGELSWAAGYIGTFPNIIPAALRSTDQGITWKLFTLANFEASAASIAINKRNPDSVYVSCNNNIYLTPDGGNSWETVFSSRGIFINTLAVDPLHPENVFAGGLFFDDSHQSPNHGVFLHSTNGGTDWNEPDADVDRTLDEVTSMIVMRKSNDDKSYVFVGTDGTGVWEYKYSTITGIGGIKDLPERFILFQNYPNPFNPETTIKYELPKEANVQLTIYNILGQKAAELVNSFQKAGRYEVNWNAKDFASGVYIYQLRAENFSQSRKLILMK